MFALRCARITPASPLHSRGLFLRCGIIAAKEFGCGRRLCC